MPRSGAPLFINVRSDPDRKQFRQLLVRKMGGARNAERIRQVRPLRNLGSKYEVALIADNSSRAKFKVQKFYEDWRQTSMPRITRKSGNPHGIPGEADGASWVNSRRASSVPSDALAMEVTVPGLPQISGCACACSIGLSLSLSCATRFLSCGCCVFQRPWSGRSIHLMHVGTPMRTCTAQVCAHMRKQRFTPQQRLFS